MFEKISYLIIALLLAFSTTTQAGEISIVPYPQQLIQKGGSFTFSRNTSVSKTANTSDSVTAIINQFVGQFELVSGIKIKSTGAPDKNKSSNIIFESDKTIPFEGYNLTVTKQSINIKASSPNGFFYALQTLYQLLPADIYGNKKSKVKTWSSPCVEITDAPRFGYRGLHLDVCRHFFPVPFIKKYIDAMAIHKLNRFHWHLTDDQGWRIEIKKHPLLTQIGSNRIETLVGHYYDNVPQRYDDHGYGGYYTQEEAREIVKYAAERFITVIPEIEMPGHATAALAAYPEFSCRKEKIKVATKWGIFEDVYCPRDTTFSFLEDILTEIMDIFPSEYIHIGGDECPKTLWKACPDCQSRIKSLGLKDESELQSYFIHRIEKFVNSKGRHIIGWDEILEGGLAPNATVMSWQGTKGGITAAKSHHNVIMTPGETCYFDKYQDDPVNEPTAIGGLLRIRDVYNYEPIPPALTADEAKYIEGAQANVWTEYMATPDQVEYMAYPRVAALAEVLWTNPENKNEKRFNENLLKQFDRYTILNINAGKAFFNITPFIKSTSGNNLEVTLNTNIEDAEVYYTLDGSEPTIYSEKYQLPITLDKNTTVRAKTYLNGQQLGNEFVKRYAVSKATGLTYLRKNMSDWQNGGSAFSLTDGVYGDTKTTNYWQAIGGNVDREIILDLKKNRYCSSVVTGMLSFPAMGGLFAPEISISVSKDGIDFEMVASEKINLPTDGIKKIYRPELVFPLTEARFIKITFKYAGSTIDVNGKAINSQLFIDEIEIN